MKHFCSGNQLNVASRVTVRMLSLSGLLHTFLPYQSSARHIDPVPHSGSSPSFQHQRPAPLTFSTGCTLGEKFFAAHRWNRTRLFSFFCTLDGLLAADGIYLTVQLSLGEYHATVCVCVWESEFVRLFRDQWQSLCSESEPKLVLRLCG